MVLPSSIPGTVAAKKEVYLENFSKYTTPQLMEIRDREMKLLTNKYGIGVPFSAFANCVFPDPD